jgi:hypothetical protein
VLYAPHMEGNRRVSVEEARRDLGGLIDAAWFKDEVLELTKHGKTRALIVNPKVMDELAEVKAENKRLRAELKALTK